MAGCLSTCRRGHPMAFVVIPTATSGPPPDGREKTTTGCMYLRRMALSSAEFIFRKRARIFVAGAQRETDCSWLRAGLFMQCTWMPRARDTMCGFAAQRENSEQTMLPPSNKILGGQAAHQWRPLSFVSWAVIFNRA